MIEKQTTRLWIALMCLVFVFFEICAYVALQFWLRPVNISSGLPRPTFNGSLPHPYKSYLYEPGGQAWKSSDPNTLYSKGGHTYDFGLFEQGIMFDIFGHGVLPEDKELYRVPKQTGEYRILFLGGSTTYQPWPFLTAAYMSRELNVSVKAISAGTGGYTSQENVADLVTSGSAYDADMIVAYLPINDIYHAARWPHFKRDYTHFRTAVTQVVSNEGETQPNRGDIWGFPFTLRFLQTILFNVNMRSYLAKANAAGLVTVKPGPDELGIWLDKESYEGTVEALIDNVLTMRHYAESRGKVFILLTQKIFKTDEPFYNFIDPYVRSAIARLTADVRLRGVAILDLDQLFPDPLGNTQIELVRSRFPGVNMNFAQPLAYDSMHFSPSSLYVVASIVGERLVPMIRRQMLEAQATSRRGE